MSEPRDEAEEILRSHGAVLARQRKHEVWKFPDGRTFVRASTPSDVNGDRNSLRQLKRLLGLDGERGIEGERRERRAKKNHKPVERVFISGPTRSFDGLRDVLMQVVRSHAPRHTCCYPMHRQTVLRTPLSVFMRRVWR
jgi:hypothetical protein